MDFECDKNRVRWGCRRGMLELDLFLLPFFDSHYDQLSADEQKQFQVLLSAKDTDLQQWFLGQSKPESPSSCALVEKIRVFARR